VGVLGLPPLHCEKARQSTIAPTRMVDVVAGGKCFVT